MKQGRFINPLDLKNNTKNIVIGNLVVEDLFGDVDPIGKYLDLNKIKFKIVGVFVERTEGSDSNEARVIYMPISTAQKIYGNNDYIDQINLTYNPLLSEQEAIAFGNKVVDKIKDMFFIAENDQSAVRARNRARENQEITQFNGVLAILVLIIGMGTLVAGVVGISNIMIFIVKERTKEIGIRKALGAPPNSIILIIILESIFITAIAGYVGLLIGGAVLNSFNLEDYWITDPGVSTSLVLAATITLVIAGTLAGYIPAKRAASIKPIVALRDE
jgi:putative ABC transport system permease protein